MDINEGKVIIYDDSIHKESNSFINNTYKEYCKFDNISKHEFKKLTKDQILQKLTKYSPLGMRYSYDPYLNHYSDTKYHKIVLAKREWFDERWRLKELIKFVEERTKKLIESIFITNKNTDTVLYTKKKFIELFWFDEDWCQLAFKIKDYIKNDENIKSILILGLNCFETLFDKNDKLNCKKDIPNEFYIRIEYMKNEICKMFDENSKNFDKSRWPTY